MDTRSTEGAIKLPKFKCASCGMETQRARDFAEHILMTSHGVPTGFVEEELLNGDGLEKLVEVLEQVQLAPESGEPLGEEDVLFCGRNDTREFDLYVYRVAKDKAVLVMETFDGEPIAMKDVSIDPEDPKKDMETWMKTSSVLVTQAREERKKADGLRSH